MSELQAFADGYLERLCRAIETFPREPLDRVLAVVDRVRINGGTLWVAGNGGSAAISDHLVCDAGSRMASGDAAPLRTVSLAANGPLMTALANDLGYQHVFESQLERCLRPEDAVLLISSSGNSPNVIAACELASRRGVPTIALVGFDGGKLRDLADVVVWVPVADYGISEDVHQAILHCLAQFIRARDDAL